MLEDEETAEGEGGGDEEENDEGPDDQTNVFTGWAVSMLEIAYTFLESKAFANDDTAICGMIIPSVTKAIKTKNTYKFNVTIFIS
ncbi:MAG TPA: hypothetical protein VFT71_09030 [Candidatus Nitrosocosmicus sp.]|nr:hypothetical protein [Candidatus Nitrosocosmicus sp.]